MGKRKSEPAADENYAQLCGAMAANGLSGAGGSGGASAAAAGGSETAEEIQVHPLSCDPTKAWRDLSTRRKLTNAPVDLPLVDLTLPKPSDKIRVVCISDTHSRLQRCMERIPHGDILIHAGDFTFMGRHKEVVEFNESLSRLPHLHKLVIAGNHELSFDQCRGRRGGHKFDHPERLLTACTYLFDSHATLYGYKFYGSPWQPPRHMDWAFNVNRGRALLDVWNRIPGDTDVLITHGPPLGHGDRSRDRLHCCDKRVGCAELLQTVAFRVRPMYHVFGHVHEGRGVTTDGTTTFVNAAVCNWRYKPVNDAIVFDLPVREAAAAH